MGIGHPLLLHERLTIGTVLPLRHVHLVAADVDIFRGEERANLTQNILQQRVVLLAGHAPAVR